MFSKRNVEENTETLSGEVYLDQGLFPSLWGCQISDL